MQHPTGVHRTLTREFLMAAKIEPQESQELADESNA